MKKRYNFKPLDLTIFVEPPKENASRKTRMCKFLKTCRQGTNCNFAHSESEIYKPECRFGNNCKKKTCKFSHPVVQPVISIVISESAPPPNVACDTQFPNLSNCVSVADSGNETLKQYNFSQIITNYDTSNIIPVKTIKHAISQYKKTSNFDKYIFVF